MKITKLFFTKLCRMALIVGGLAAIGHISSAIGETIVLLRRMDNEQAESLATMSYEHQQAMAVLNNEQVRENNRHAKFMELLQILKTAVNQLGNDIFNAECEGCKGLPGNSFNVQEPFKIFYHLNLKNMV